MARSRSEQEPPVSLDGDYLTDGSSVIGKMLRDADVYSSPELDAMNGMPIGIQELQQRRGLAAQNPVKGYSAIGPLNMLQQIPSEVPGIVGLMSLKFGEELGGVTDQNLVAFHSDWMPYSLGQQVQEAKRRSVDEYSPDRNLSSLYLIFRNVDGSWVLEDKLRDTDPHHRTGYVNFNVTVEEKDNEGVTTGRRYTKPIVGLLNTFASAGVEDFKDTHGHEKYRGVIDKITEVIGRHIDPGSDYDYRKDGKLDDSISEQVENYFIINANDPFNITVPVMSWFESMQIDLERERRRKAGILTQNDINLMEDRKEELREEVLEAVSLTMAEPAIRNIQISKNGTLVDPKRWMARVITPLDMQVISILANDPESPCYQAAREQLMRYNGLAEDTLVVTQTDGNELIRGMSYKPGNPAAAKLIATKDGSFTGFTYRSGKDEMIPVDQRFGIYPVEIPLSLRYPATESNKVSGILGIMRVKGEGMNDNKGDTYLWYDGLQGYSQVALGALKYFNTVRRRIREEGSEAILPAPPTLLQLLTEKTGIEPALVLAFQTEHGMQVKAVCGTGSGVEVLRTPEGMRPRLSLTNLHKKQKVNLSKETTSAKNSSRSLIKWGKTASSIQPARKDIDRFTVIPESVKSDEIALAGLVVRADANRTVYGMRRTGVVRPADLIVMPNDRSRLRELKRKYEAPAAKTYGRRTRKGR